MGKKISNFSIIFYTVCILIIAVLGYSYLKITEIRNQRLTYSMEENIKYYAKRCVLEEKCKSELTLKDLYDNGYMSEVVDPVTKEILDYNTKIISNDGVYIIKYVKKTS